MPRQPAIDPASGDLFLVHLRLQGWRCLDGASGLLWLAVDVVLKDPLHTAPNSRSAVRNPPALQLDTIKRAECDFILAVRRAGASRTERNGTDNEGANVSFTTFSPSTLKQSREQYRDGRRWISHTRVAGLPQLVAWSEEKGMGTVIPEPCLKRHALGHDTNFCNVKNNVDDYQELRIEILQIATWSVGQASIDPSEPCICRARDNGQIWPRCVSVEHGSIPQSISHHFLLG